MPSTARTVLTMPSTPSRQHYEGLEALRREHREELKVRLEELRASLTPVHAGEVNDIEALCDTSSSAGVWAAMVEITSRKLQDVERALGRLQRGRYGRCSDCGAEVSAARLRAMPYAERCRDCQELADAGRNVLAA
jgi:DnaK suppressor protein